MPDPRTRKSRHELTPDNLSSSILISNLPSTWTQSTVTSVIAGSGPVVKVSEKIDPRNGRILGIIIDYLTSKNCKRAVEILQKIKNFSCKMERIIPSNWASREDLSEKDILELKRDSYPWEDNLELPFELVSEVPIPRRPVTKSATPAASSNGQSFPEILSKASQHLPGLQKDALEAADPVSINLSNIPPLQLLEMISNLKMLSNQDASKRVRVEQFLRGNNIVTITVAQALLEMGFINYAAVTKVISELQSAPAQNTPRQSSATINFIQPHIMPHMQPMLNMMHPQIMGVPPQPTSPAASPFFMNPPPAAPMAQPVQPAHPVPPAQPIQSAQPLRINESKLTSLPRTKQDMIRQVINLPQEQIQLLPPDQVSVIENLRKEYLI